MLVKVLASLGLILIFNRLISSLAVCVLIGTLALALFFGQTFSSALPIAAGSLLSTDNACLMAVIFLVIWLSSQMAEAGVMRDLVDAVRRRLSPRHAMAVLPALIGLLPMPGGAIFSAPLVERCDPSGATSPVLKARANFWFRHIWEYWWPLYPGLLLAMHLTGLDFWQFMLLGLPLTLVAVAGGHFFLLRRIGHDLPDEPASGRSDAPSVGRLLAPIALVIVGYAVFRLAAGLLHASFPALPPVNRYVPMIFGILMAMALQACWRPLPKESWKRILFSRNTLNLALIVAAVRIYGAFIEAPLPGGDSPIALMQVEMEHWGIPRLAMIMLLPFVAGLTTGVSVGFVGASFPIVISLMGVDPPLSTILAFTVLGFACGHIGQMLSPVHVCLVVTNEHFKTNLYHSLRGLLIPSLMVVLTALAMHFLILR